MKSPTIVIREEYSVEGSRYLSAHLTEGGDLSIEGQDLGPGVEEFWGPGLREYEWVITIRAAHVPQLVSVFGGKQGDDILSLLAARCSESQQHASKSFFEERGIPIEFWSRVGE